MDLLRIVRNSGVPFKEVPGWQKRGRPGSFSPVGVINHHTATPVGSNALNTIINGRPGLNGPLSQFFLARNGVVHLVAAGRANHAGKGSGAVLAAVRAGRSIPRPGVDDTDGNTHFIGIEVENNGVGEPYPSKQINSLIKLNAAINRAKGWSENHNIHHREWTRRKIDMSWRGDLRGLIRKQLRPGPIKRVVKAVKKVIPARFKPWRGRYLKLRDPYMSGPDVKEMQDTAWKKGYGIDRDGIFGKQSHGIVGDIQRDNGFRGKEIDNIYGPATHAKLVRMKNRR